MHDAVSFLLHYMNLCILLAFELVRRSLECISSLRAIWLLQLDQIICY